MGIYVHQILLFSFTLIHVELVVAAVTETVYLRINSIIIGKLHIWQTQLVIQMLPEEEEEEEKKKKKKKAMCILAVRPCLLVPPWSTIKMY